MTEIVPSKRAKYRVTAHKGVRLIPPSPPQVKTWRVRWKNPDTGGTEQRTLTAEEAKTVDTRASVAMDKWRSLRRRTEDIRDGDSPHTAARTELDAAFDRYFTDALISAKTVKVYRSAVRDLLEWAELMSVRTVRDLTAPRLREFRGWLPKSPKLSPKRGGAANEVHRRGKRSPHSVNKVLRAISTILNELRSRGVIRLSSDDIADGLKRIPAVTERKEFLMPEQIRKLIEVCRAHDQETFAATRKGAKDKRRFDPLEPFVTFVLLTGMRVSEALAVERSMVVGTDIHLPASITKTKKPRTVDLDISPMLITLVEGLPKHGKLFPDLTYDSVEGARARIETRGFGDWSWNSLRRTCGTYTTCAPSIYGAASAWMSAQRLGHGIGIAQAHYVGRIKISAEAKTLEEAMGLPMP